MVLCPYALLSSCAKCPVEKICLLKSVIGDHKKQDSQDTLKKTANKDNGSPE